MEPMSPQEAVAELKRTSNWRPNLSFFQGALFLFLAGIFLIFIFALASMVQIRKELESIHSEMPRKVPTWGEWRAAADLAARLELMKQRPLGYVDIGKVEGRPIKVDVDDWSHSGPIKVDVDDWSHIGPIDVKVDDHWPVEVKIMK